MFVLTAWTNWLLHNRFHRSILPVLSQLLKNRFAASVAESLDDFIFFFFDRDVSEKNSVKGYVASQFGILTLGSFNGFQTSNSFFFVKVQEI